jgi:hypothetical protein
MVRAADPDEQQYAQTALRLDAPPTAELLTLVREGLVREGLVREGLVREGLVREGLVREGLVRVPGRNVEEGFELLAMKADIHQAALRARHTGS